MRRGIKRALLWAEVIFKWIKPRLKTDSAINEIEVKEHEKIDLNMRLNCQYRKKPRQCPFEAYTSTRAFCQILRFFFSSKSISYRTKQRCGDQSIQWTYQRFIQSN